MDDIDRIVEAVTATAEVMGQQMTATAIALIAEDLSEYPIADVDKALRRVRRECQWFSLAAVIERLPNGWPGPDEAWAAFPKDERETGVITPEAMQAWTIAMPLWDGGDQIGARMAFREAYVRLVAECTARRPTWTVTLGYDRDARVAPIQRAVEAGRLTHDEAQKFLPHYSDGDDTGPVVGLLTGKVSKIPVSDETRKRLADLRKMLDNKA